MPQKRAFYTSDEHYACSGAPTGQTLAQLPHSMHVSASITYFESPSAMHDTGHSEAQAPQLMHSSEIAYAINKTPPLFQLAYMKSSYSLNYIVSYFCKKASLFYFLLQFFCAGTGNAKFDFYAIIPTGIDKIRFRVYY